MFTKVQTQPELSHVERCDPMFMQEMTRKWQAREIDNFTYLMHLNSVADRSVNDLTQYPVMPGFPNDFKSDELDPQVGFLSISLSLYLSISNHTPTRQNPKTFRDLTKPIGALEPKRLKTFLQRYEQMPTGKGISATFHVRYALLHTRICFSTTWFEIVRSILCLQNGRFDRRDRIFTDIQAT